MDSRDAPVRLMVAVTVRLYREGLVTALGSDRFLTVVASAEDPEQALAAALGTCPEVAVIDVAFPNALGLMRALGDSGWNGRVVAFAVSADESQHVGDYAAAGARGFVTASESLEGLVEVIRRTAAGELLCSPSMAVQMLRAFARDSSGPSNVEIGAEVGLTEREAQVLKLIREGLSNKQIATKLSIATATVKNHVHHVLAKLQVQNRSQAAALNGWLSKDSVAKRAFPQVTANCWPNQPR